MNNYVLNWHDSAKNTGGSKAKADVITFLLKRNFKIIDTPSSNLGKIWSSITSYSKLKKLNGTLLIQYPSGKPLLRKLWLTSARRCSNLKVIFLIHDLESIRFHNNEEHTKDQNEEIRFLNKAHGLISLNHKMTTLLKSRGITIPITDLKVWDYDNSQTFNNNFEYDGSVCYAGNLIKADYLTKLNIDTPLHVFGPNANLKFPKNVIYEGQYSPQELPKKLKQNFGLVWDGISPDTCTGIYGQYMRYNDPHKVSLYLSTGIPVIVWKDAAIADFIKENRVGILIDSLNKLDDVLDSVNSAEFAEMKKNAQRVGLQMRQGFFLNNAFDQLAQLI